MGSMILACSLITTVSRCAYVAELKIKEAAFTELHGDLPQY